VTERCWDAAKAKVFWRISSKVSPPLPPDAASTLLDERELKRKQRVEAQLLKNADYIEKTTLENKEEELLRDSMMRDALHFDSEYANKKNRVIRKKR
jgi:hypothetical protein